MKDTDKLVDDIYVIDDLIPLELQKKLSETVKQQMWGYNWQTGHDDLYPVWGRSVASPLRGNHNVESKLLEDRHQIEAAAIWELFTKSFLKGHSLMRSFVIGFHHGCEGYVHADNIDPEDAGSMGTGLNLANYRSTILFAFNEWEAKQGGEMVIYNRDMTDILQVVQAKPFRIISFPGLLPHKPNGPTRETSEFLPLLSYRSKQILRL